MFCFFVLICYNNKNAGGFITRKSKNLKIILYTALFICASVFVSVLGVGVFAFEDNSNNSTLKAQASYAITYALTTGDVNYKNNTNFTISNFSQLTCFSNSVTNGCSFSDKTVKLTKDIVFTKTNSGGTYNGNWRKPMNVIGAYFGEHGGWDDGYLFKDIIADNVPKFKGTFDGDGHMLSGMQLNAGYHCDEVSLDKGSVYYYNAYDYKTFLGFTQEYSVYIKGLFGVLGDNATIKNLHVDNFYIGAEKTGCCYAMLGTICGLAYGENITIQNCKVTNGITICDRYYERKTKNCEINDDMIAIAGICAAGEPIIENCYVENFSASYVEKEDDDDGGFAHVGPAKSFVGPEFEGEYAFTFYSNGATVSNCLVKGYDYQFLNYDIHENESYVYPEDLEISKLIHARSTVDVTDDSSEEEYYYTGCDYPIAAYGVSRCYYVITETKYSVSGYKKGNYNSNRTAYTKGNGGISSSVGASSVGGKYVSGYPWYWATDYNSAYPQLRVFMDWKTINFQATTGGSVEPESIEIPQDISPTVDIGKAELNILGQTITATPDEGYKWVEGDKWTKNSDTSYTANFELKKYTLTFADATGVESGDNAISPTGTNSFEVYHGTTVTASYSSGEEDLTYTFKIVSGQECTVTYPIPDKYTLTRPGDVGDIKGDTTIEPTVAIKTFNIRFNAVTYGSVLEVTDATQTEATHTSTYEAQGIKYGTKIQYTTSATGFSFKWGSNIVSYTIQDGFKFEKLQIIKDGEESNHSEFESLTGNLTIIPSFSRWYTITFAKIDHTTSPTSAQTMKVKSGGNITATLSNANKTLTYSYDGTSVVYQASQFYILSKDSNDLTNIQEDKTITPNAIFHACTVTMKNTSKDGNSAMANLSGYSAPFNVEFGTTLSVSESINGSNITTYTYTFKHGVNSVKTVTYTTTNAKYEIDSYGINGTATSYSFTNTNEKAKTISPTFKVKQYQLTVKETKDGSTTTTNKITYYGDIITYSANLSLSSESHFTYSSASQYQSIATTQLEYTGYFVESYMLKNGATSSTVDVDGTTVSNTTITVTADIEISITFATFHTVTFKTGQTGVSSTTALNSYSNQINLRSGWKVTGTYSGYPSRELKYSISKADGSGVVEVFKYTLAQFYRVTNTNNVTSLQENTEIDPTIEFYACTVTMGSIGSGIGERNITLGSYTNDDYEVEDGKIEFIVEYKTKVEFKKENTATAGLFKYTYTFKDEAGNKLLTVTYTITNNEYAMEYDLDAEGERIRMYNGINGAVDSDSATFEEGETSKPISPTFDKKQYLGEVA